MTTKEQVISHLLSMTEEQINRLTNLLNRFNWDLEATLEYLQSEQGKTA